MKEETRAALESFRKQLLPDAAIAIDDDVDNQQFQIAARKAYETLFDQFKNWDQRNVFAICGIGFAQSLSAPELGVIYCEGLFNVVDFKEPVSERAMAHKMEDGRDFYRLAWDSLSGLGFTFISNIFRRLAALVAGGIGAGAMGWVGARSLENYVKQNATKFGELTRRVHHPAEHVASAQQSRCVIP